MVCSIVCEYNPFHKGHERQIQYLKGQGHQVICIMSGSFVQRGETAVYSKWIRTKWALLAGADLVLELPVFYSLQSAQGFARGAIASLYATGMVDAVSFGMEVQDVSTLQSMARLQQSDGFSLALKAHLAAGLSYPRAMEQAAKESLTDLPLEAFSPNSLLGVEYLKAMAELHWSPALLPLHRGADSPTATSCRGEIHLGQQPNGVPGYVQRDLTSLTPAKLEDLTQLILYRLRTMDPDSLAMVEDVSEGLHNRIITAAKQHHDLPSMMDAVSSGRYTRARVRRIICCALLGITKAELDPYRKTPPYIRVLGVQGKERSLLGKLTKNCTVPVISSSKDFSSVPLFQKELMATELYSIATHQNSGADYTTPLIVTP